MIRRPPRSTLFPTRRSSDLANRLLTQTNEASGSPKGKRKLAQGCGESATLGQHDSLRIPCKGQITSRLCTHLLDRKSTRLNSSHLVISYAVFCLKKKNTLHI